MEKIQSPMKTKAKRGRVGAGTRRRSRERGGKLDVQKMLEKTGIEFHWPGYQYMGPGTKLKNVWRVEIQASIDWTKLPSSMTSATVKAAT